MRKLNQHGNRLNHEACMAEFHEVFAWLPERGYFHIVARDYGGWLLTLCGNLESGNLHADTVKSISAKQKVCRKCRKNLKSAKLVREYP